MFESPIKEEE